MHICIKNTCIHPSIILMYVYIIHAPDTDRDQDELIVVDDDVEEGARDLMELPSR